VTVNVCGDRVESGLMLARRCDDLLTLPKYEEQQRSERRSWPAKQGKRLRLRH